MAHNELEPPPVYTPPDQQRTGPERSRDSHLPPTDYIEKRLAIGLIVSIVVNLSLWPFAAQFVRHHKLVQPQTMEVVFVPRIPAHPVKPKPKPKPHKIIVPPKPIPKPIPKPVAPVQHPHSAPSVHHPSPAQHEAHNRVLIAPGKSTQPTDHTALPGGNAGVGKPTEAQNPGNDQNNTPPTPAPKPAPPITPAQQPVQQPEPKPAPPPPPAGPTQDAESVNQVLPDIPDDLKQDDFKSSVRVKVEINADGSFIPTLRTSSGNDQIDQIVLEALKKWKWKPALRDGQPVDSIQLFRFDFEVN